MRSSFRNRIASLRPVLTAAQGTQLDLLSFGSVADCPPRSLYSAAWEEAHRHKWIESERHGHDLGKAALKDWFRRHWLPFCRRARLEHIEGSQRWLEFAEHEFGQVFELLVQGDLLLDRILDRMEIGYDNLEIINWALDAGLHMDRVLELLEMIDINRARLEPIAGVE